MKTSRTRMTLFAGMSVLSLLALATVACGDSKSGSATGETPSGTSGGPKASATAAAPDFACPSGAYKNADPPFCVTLPTGFKAQPERKFRGGKAVNFQGASMLDSFDIVWEKGKSYDDALKTAENIASGDFKVDSKGDLPDRTGKYWDYKDKDGEHWILAYVKGKEYVYTCEVQTKHEGDSAAKLAACKSLVGP